MEMLQLVLYYCYMVNLFNYLVFCLGYTKLCFDYGVLRVKMKFNLGTVVSVGVGRVKKKLFTKLNLCTYLRLLFIIKCLSSQSSTFGNFKLNLLFYSILLLLPMVWDISHFSLFSLE